MITDYIIPILTAFIITVLIGPIGIKQLTRLKFGQYVRDDGPKEHLKKTGTPTMGGLIFLSGIIVTTLFFGYTSKTSIAILLVTVGFGIIGFLDDFIKVVMKRSLGLRAYQKLLGQLGIALVYCYYMLEHVGIDTKIMIPFSNGFYLDMGILFIPFIIVVMLGTVNGVNLTDGLDGLTTSVTILVATFFMVVSMGLSGDIYPVTGAVIGSLLAFLAYNSHPAKVFMGDTGSLALGGFVAATAISQKMPLFILIVGIIYFVETLSVMIQVGYFKMTGERVFKMAPIHHHYELKGWKETKVVSVFGIVTTIACLIGLYALKGFN